MSSSIHAFGVARRRSRFSSRSAHSGRSRSPSTAAAISNDAGLKWSSQRTRRVPAGESSACSAGNVSSIAHSNPGCRSPGRRRHELLAPSISVDSGEPASPGVPPKVPKAIWRDGQAQRHSGERRSRSSIGRRSRPCRQRYRPIRTASPPWIIAARKRNACRPSKMHPPGIAAARPAKVVSSLIGNTEFFGEPTARSECFTTAGRSRAMAVHEGWGGR